MRVARARRAPRAAANMHVEGELPINENLAARLELERADELEVSLGADSRVSDIEPSELALGGASRLAPWCVRWSLWPCAQVQQSHCMGLGM